MLGQPIQWTCMFWSFHGDKTQSFLGQTATSRDLWSPCQTPTPSPSSGWWSNGNGAGLRNVGLYKSLHVVVCPRKLCWVYGGPYNAACADYSLSLPLPWPISQPCRSNPGRTLWHGSLHFHILENSALDLFSKLIFSLSFVSTTSVSLHDPVRE